MSEPKYIYALDLGPKFGPRLEQLAVRANRTGQVEWFAALLLKHAIEDSERDFDEAEERRKNRTDSPPLPASPDEPDENIPF